MHTLTKWTSVIGLCLTTSMPVLADTTNQYDSRSFAIAEHVSIGNNINLSFSPDEPPQKGIILTMPNGLKLTYGDLISFGDFYGIVGQPISKADSPNEMKERFNADFNTFTTSPDTLDEANQILNISKQEQTIVTERMKNGEAPEAIYKSIGNEVGRQLNCATGGGCDPDTWWATPGRFLNLARDNYDHFRDNAILAYRAGHQAAIQQAIVAHQTNDRRLLEKAYAMNGFACHFLADRFSAGHLRTPRNELPEHVTPALVGALLSGYMHNEESRYGLHVHNKLGNQWVAYGDWSYFSHVNENARYIIHDALQASADEIYSAYLYGSVDTHDNALDYLPIPDETANQNRNDISPMFYWDSDSNAVLRRTLLADPYDRHWTANWWGWSTLAELRALEK